MVKRAGSTAPVIRVVVASASVWKALRVPGMPSTAQRTVPPSFTFGRLAGAMSWDAAMASAEPSSLHPASTGSGSSTPAAMSAA